MKRWLLTVWMVSALSLARADEPLKIAGRELPHYQAQLDSDNRVVRLAAAKTLGAFGEAAGPALLTALKHEDPAVRYTAAVHLGRIGGKHLKKANEALLKMRHDASSLAAQQAAAFALCRAGSLDGHLSLLIERLSYPERGMACSAAELLGMIGPPASPALETLEKVKQDNPATGKGDYHLGGAAGHAIDKIQSATK
ncbi:MAG: HEAT repeat domain-containing protein [Planctomycetaceae bacterium]